MSDAKGAACPMCEGPAPDGLLLVCPACRKVGCRSCIPGGYQLVDGTLYGIKGCRECRGNPESYRRWMMDQLA